MTTKARVGYVKTYSSGIGSGSVEVEVSGRRLSLPFPADVVSGAGAPLKSGDRVHVTLRTAKGVSSVTRVERSPAVLPPPDARPAPESPGSVSSTDWAEVEVPVEPSGGTQARFTRSKFIQSGSRLDFS